MWYEEDSTGVETERTQYRRIVSEERDSYRSFRHEMMMQND